MEGKPRRLPSRRCAPTTAIIQQLTSPENDAPSEEDDAAAAMDTDTDDANPCPAVPKFAGAPDPVAVLELHERLHETLADCRCCAAPTGRGLFCVARCPV